MGALERNDGPDHDQPLAALRTMWAELLDLPEHAITDDSHFLELGGGSMLLLSLQARIHGAFGRELHVADLLDHPTPAGQARLIEASRARCPHAGAP